MKHLTIQKNKGFTLLESMVAVTILAISVSAPLYAANRAYVAAMNASYQLTANYLAQEGIELVRLKRDNFYLNDGPLYQTFWNSFTALQSTCTSGTPCQVDAWVNVGAPAVGNCAPDCALYIKPSGAYTHVASGNTKSIYTRMISLSNVTPDEEIVTVKVSWSYHNTPYTITINDHLTQWGPHKKP